MSTLLPSRTGFTIYQSSYCPYCKKAIDLLEKYSMTFKNIDIETIQGNLPKILSYFRKHESIYAFNNEHKTRPLIFYNGKFIGGFSELESLFS